MKRDWGSRGEAMITAYEEERTERYTQVRVPDMEQVTASKTDRQWYAVQTYSRHEKQVRDRLMAVGIEPLLPLGKQCRQWSDRKVWTTLPLFSGYCFANFALAGSLAVLQVPGVARIVGALKPEPIPAEEIAVLQQVSSVNRMMEPCDYLIEGAWVEVIRGPLVGLRGQLVRRASHHGLVIRASLLQRAALIHIGTDEIVPLQ
ncbi:MAG: transcription termination/antitermination NusG family protein [Nitrospira sp.]|nr:transcription termination/antitermination NusG family protein [Nitrospira sp.]